MEHRFDGDSDALGKVLGVLPEVVLVVDFEGTILYINHVEEGYEREAVLGMNVDAILPPASREVFWSVLRAVGRTGKMEKYEIEMLSPAGEAQWYRSRMIPLEDDGDVIGVVIMATNISELRVAEAQVERLRRLLPICAWCDRIQTEEGTWMTIEAHLERERGSKVSHGMCPDCYREQMEDDDGGDGSGGNEA